MAKPCGRLCGGCLARPQSAVKFVGPSVVESSCRWAAGPLTAAHRRSPAHPGAHPHVPAPSNLHAAHWRWVRSPGSCKPGAASHCLCRPGSQPGSPCGLAAMRPPGDPCTATIEDLGPPQAAAAAAAQLAVAPAAAAPPAPAAPAAPAGVVAVAGPPLPAGPDLQREVNRLRGTMARLRGNLQRRRKECIRLRGVVRRLRQRCDDLQER